MGTPQKAVPTVMAKALEKTSKTELIRTFGKLTTTQILRTGYPSISKLERSYPDKIEKVVQMLVADVNHSFGNEMDTLAIEEVAVELLTPPLRNLSLEDVFVAFREMKAKETFGKLTVHKVTTSLNKYWNQRLKLAAEVSYQNHVSAKPREGERNCEIGIKTYLKQLKEKES